MSNPVEQHIVSACLLKQFAKSEELIIEDLILLDQRLINDENLIHSGACYKVLLDDFNRSQDFKIKKSNIIKPKNKKFCEKNLYSINTKKYRKFLEYNNMTDPRSDKDIRFSLEINFGKSENKFGKFMNFWNNNFDIEALFNNYENEIISFVISNELRGKHIYKSSEVAPLPKRNIENYEDFDKLIFSSFLMLHFSDILEKLDHYEAVEITNFIPMTQTYKDLEIRNCKINTFVSSSLDSIKDKFLILLKNNTDLSFLLSDVSSSVIYENNINFNQILEIIGNDNFERKPGKISIMPLNRHILAIVSDSPFKRGSSLVSDKNKIKKINSLFYFRTNNWLVVYDVFLKRNEIVDEIFLMELNGGVFLSGFLNWYKNSQEKESYSNSKYGYIKIKKEDFDQIKIVINLLIGLNVLVNELKPNEDIYFNKKGKKVMKYNGILASKVGDTGKVLIVGNKKIFDILFNFEQSQLECFKHALTLCGLISSFYISKEENKIYFCKDCFFKKENSVLFGKDFF